MSDPGPEDLATLTGGFNGLSLVLRHAGVAE